MHGTQSVQDAFPRRSLERENDQFQIYRKKVKTILRISEFDQALTFINTIFFRVNFFLAGLSQSIGQAQGFHSLQEFKNIVPFGQILD